MHKSAQTADTHSCASTGGGALSQAQVVDHRADIKYVWVRLQCLGVEALSEVKWGGLSAVVRTALRISYLNLPFRALSSAEDISREEY